ncbi:hypothetical protein ACS0TY_021473 [Phlomoides rotata]
MEISFSPISISISTRLPQSLPGIPASAPPSPPPRSHRWPVHPVATRSRVSPVHPVATPSPPPSSRRCLPPLLRSTLRQAEHSAVEAALVSLPSRDKLSSFFRFNGGGFSSKIDSKGELIQEKIEVKKLVNFLKQASEDAKKLVNQEKSFACAEIESARADRAVVQRIGDALDEQEINQSSGKQHLTLL